MGWHNRCCGDDSCEIGVDTFQRVSASDTGWVVPGTVAVAEDGADWSGLANLAADDDVYASSTIPASGNSKKLDCSNFGFAVPSDALVTGIEVRYRRFASAGSALFSSLTIFSPINNIIGSSDYDPPSWTYGGRWESTETEKTFGDSTYTWRCVLTPGEVNSSSFKVRIAVSNTSGSPVTANIDILEVKVHYLTSPIGAGWYVSSGTWNMMNYDGDHCVITDDAGAYLRFETAHPDGVAEHTVLINFVATSLFWEHGDKLRIVLCDTLFVELEIGFNQVIQTTPFGCMILRLFNGATLLQESIPFGIRPQAGRMALWGGYSATTGVLWGALEMVEGEAPTTVYMKENVGTVVGTKVGIGTGDVVDGTIIFSHFQYFHHNYGTTVTWCYEPGNELTLTCVFTKSPFYFNAGDPILDVGCGWEIVSGVWSGIEYGYYSGPGADYLETTSANALIQCTQDQSAWNCIEYTDFGYQVLWVQIAWCEAQGDTVRFYVDWDTVEGHWAEITCGDSEGKGAIVKLGKGATVLETAYLEIGPMPLIGGREAPFMVYLCTFVSDDGQDAVAVTVEGFWDYYLPYHNDYTVSMVSYTTVYGNKRVAFGTGGTVNGKVHFGNYITGSANANACRTCAHSECPPCPAGDGPQGLIFDISGFLNRYGQYCGNCSNVDGTYVVPSIWGGGGSCEGRRVWFICAGPVEFGQLQYYLWIYWEIVEVVPSGWKLVVTLKFQGIGAYEPPDCDVIYSKEFSSTTRCDTIADEVLSWESGPTAPEGCLCDGVTSLTISVTAY